MMALLWQQIVIGLIIAAAVIYLVVRYIRRRRRQIACSRCGLMKLARPDDKPAPRP